MDARRLTTLLLTSLLATGCCTPGSGSSVPPEPARVPLPPPPAEAMEPVSPDFLTRMLDFLFVSPETPTTSSGD